MMGLNPSLTGAVQLRVAVTRPFVGADHCTPRLRGDEGATGVAATTAARRLRRLITSKRDDVEAFTAETPMRRVEGTVDDGHAHVGNAMSRTVTRPRPSPLSTATVSSANDDVKFGGRTLTKKCCQPVEGSAWCSGPTVFVDVANAPKG